MASCVSEPGRTASGDRLHHVSRDKARGQFSRPSFLMCICAKSQPGSL